MVVESLLYPNHPLKPIRKRAEIVGTDEGKKFPTAVGNALLGAYVNNLGLNADIVAFVTTAGPDSIRWLNTANADSIGLSVSFLDNKRQARANFNLALKNR